MTSTPPTHPHRLDVLVAEIRGCRRCEATLPLGPRPVLLARPGARILIAGQAPGRRVHDSGVPFDDPSGERLRAWMGVDRREFYDSPHIAVVPMAFCYPGTGTSGDLPPPPACAAAWRARLLAELPAVALTLVIGRYAQTWHLPGRRKASLTETVRAFDEYAPARIPLPHPSPRNNNWLRRNPWFAAEVLPRLRTRVRALLT